ncbi:MAG: hypothetical protein AAF701_03860 [Pseudomonadota bacterium]
MDNALTPGFDRYIAVDWSARSKPSPVKPTADAIFMCDTSAQGQTTTYHRTRHSAFQAVCHSLDDAMAQGQRVILGFDFAYGYPLGFAKRLTGRASAHAVWQWMADHIIDAPDNHNNRFAVAGAVNARFPGLGPFWGCPATVQIDGLPHKGSLRHGHGMDDQRLTDAQTKGTQSVWKLFTTGSVGSQVLMGLPYLWRLKQRYGGDLQIWPFDQGGAAPIACVEIFPSHYSVAYPNPPTDPIYQIKDALQVKMTCDMLRAVDNCDDWARIMAPAVAADPTHMSQEGWIFGAGLGKITL